MNDQDVSATFVARIWLDRDDETEPKWRGHVEHVQSGKQEYFDTLSSLQGFLSDVTGVPGPDGGLDEAPAPPSCGAAPGTEKRDTK